MTRPLGVILAGGQARRMGGGDKGRLMLGEHSLLAHVIDRFGPQVESMAINANGDPARFADLGLPVLADSLPDYPGPLAGVLAGLDWAASQGADAIVTAAADTPFLPLDLVGRLQEVGGLVLAKDGDGYRHPTFGLWPVVLRADLRKQLKAGLRKIVAWTDMHGGRDAVFPDPAAFFNINTPEDLAIAEATL